MNIYREVNPLANIHYSRVIAKKKAYILIYKNQHTSYLYVTIPYSYTHIKKATKQENNAIVACRQLGV